VVSSERVSVGRGLEVDTHFAHTYLRGVSTSDAIARLKRWLDRVPVPTSTRFAFDEIFEVDPAIKKVTQIGVRSFLLVGESVVHANDIADAELMNVDGGVSDAYIAVTFTPDGAARMENGTDHWVKRRMSILLDGVVIAAPVVQARISSGRLIIDRADASEARRIADNLKPR